MGSIHAERLNAAQRSDKFAVETQARILLRHTTAEADINSLRKRYDFVHSAKKLSPHHLLYCVDPL